MYKFIEWREILSEINYRQSMYLKFHIICGHFYTRGTQLIIVREAQRTSSFSCIRESNWMDKRPKNGCRNFFDG